MRCWIFTTKLCIDTISGPVSLISAPIFSQLWKSPPFALFWAEARVLSFRVKLNPGCAFFSLCHDQIAPAERVTLWLSLSHMTAGRRSRAEGLGGDRSALRDVKGPVFEEMSPSIDETIRRCGRLNGEEEASIPGPWVSTWCRGRYRRCWYSHRSHPLPLKWI